jgi:Protein of unknown function (DUF2846)
MRNLKSYSKLMGENVQTAACLMIAGMALAASPVYAKKKEVAAFQELGPGQGQIVFFRNGSMVGSALACDVRENTKLVGNLTNGIVFGVAFDAGSHMFNPKSEPANTLSVDVKAGEVYFINCAFSGGHIVLSRSDQKRFDEKASKLTAKTTDELAKEIAKDAGKKK